jgi:TonB family protein
VTVHDYPAASLRDGEQGMTTAEYEIDETGRVTPGSCVVKASSDYPRLDKRACEVIEQRFRFEPALENGRPVRERRRQDIFWLLPGRPDQEGFTDEATRRLYRYSNCIVQARPEVAQKAVSLPFGSPEQDAAVRLINGRKLKCSDPQHELKFAPRLLIGPLSEALLLVHFRGSELPQLPAGSVPLAPRNGTEALAHCLVRRNHSGIVALLETVPTGPDEKAAINKIVPDVSQCMTPGTTMRFDRFSMRSILATALYRDAAYAAAQGRR